MDLDIDDLLTEGPSPSKPPPSRTTRGAAGRGGARGRGAKASPSVYDDDFYKNMAVEDEDTDMSEADPQKMVQSMDLDAMDAEYMEGNNKSKNNSGPGATKPGSKSAKKDIDFDLDDPLAGLLSDEDDDPAPKKPAPVSKPAANTLMMEPEIQARPSKMLEIERPPTRSGSSTNESPPPARKPAPAARKKDDFLFDDNDDDVLGGMGLDDSPPRSKPTSKPMSADSDEPRAGGAKSILNDLLGGSSKSRPGTGGENRAATTLDTLLVGASTPKTADGGGGRRRTPVKKAPAEDEEINFGGYNPSAASSRPSSKRSVRFEDGDDLFGDRPKTTPMGSRKKGGASFLENMLEKDDRDWLDIAAGGKNESSRPVSAPDSRKQDTSFSARDKAGTSDEPVDWLGLSRLGSPGTSPRSSAKGRPSIKSRWEDDSDDDKKQQQQQEQMNSSGGPVGRRGRSPGSTTPTAGQSPPTPRRTSPRRPRSISPSNDGDDWLGRKETTRKSGKDGMDWLDSKDDDIFGKKDDDIFGKKDDDIFGKKKTDDIFGSKDDDIFGKSNEKKADNKDSDWLGMKSSMKKEREKVSDWLNDDKNEARKKPEAGTDFLGLGDEVDPDSILGKGKKPVKTVEDLFSPPAKRETKDLPEPRRGKAAQSPVRAQSPAEASEPGTTDHLDAILQQKRSSRHQQQQPQSQQSAVYADPDAPSSHRLAAHDASSHHIASGATTSQFNVGAGGAGFNMEQMKQQHEQRMRQQQEEVQNKIAEQQQLMQMQMQQQMEQQMQQQQQQMAAMASQQPMMGNFGFGGWMGDESKVLRLEQERDHLRALLDTLRRHHQEQLDIVEDACKKQVALLEETYARRESRLKGEIEEISTQSRQNLSQLEAERANLISQHNKNLQEVEVSHSDTLKQLREQHMAQVQQIQKEHSASLARLRTAADNEVSAVINTSAHAKNLQAVISQVGERAKDLSDLQYQVEVSHTNNLSTREQVARDRDSQLKMLQERLERQQQEGEVERARLQGLLTTLETQLTEQTRQSEQEKWRVRQEENRLKAMQESVQREREQQIEQLLRERREVEQSKESILGQQQTTLRQVHEERRLLAEEKARFQLQAKMQAEQDGQSAVHQIKTESELDATVKALNEEKQRLRMRAEEIERQAGTLSKEQASLEQERYTLRIERQKMEQMAMTVKQRSQDIEEMCGMAAQAREEGHEALEAARKTESEQQQRVHNIHGQLTQLRDAEKHIAEERLALAREKQAVDTSRSSALCIACRTPVRDSTPQSNAVPLISVEQASPSSSMPAHMSPAAQQLYHSLPQEFQNSMVHDLSQSIQRDREVRLWRINADKDKEFLEEEGMFLQAIKHAPYHPQTPTHDN